MSSSTRARQGAQAQVRETNLSLIMQRLHEQHALSRAALADITGLNKSTVSSLVQQLMEMSFVHEVGLNSGGVGRPSMQLEFNPEAGIMVSCELGVDFISAICTTFAAEVIWRHKESTRGLLDQTAIIHQLLALLHEALRSGRRHCPQCGPLMGLALGVPGLVDRANGTLLFAPNLGWRDVALRDYLAESFAGVPVFVDNEANMAALGENLFGAARGYRDVLFISAGVGLGGAIVRSDQLVRGTTGFAGEFGHMTVDPDGELCNCGNRGCWETCVSQSAVFRHIRRSIAQGRDSLLLLLTGSNLDQLSIPLVVEAARSGDSVALDALARVGEALGTGLASLVNALNPDLVVFGGILSLGGEFLMPVVEQVLRQRALRWNAEATRLILARHGVDACVMGGIATIFQAILLEPGKYSPQKTMI